jgi:hypothetical protein
VKGVALKPEISIEKVWFDDDLSELKISVCNGKSLFTNKVYVGSHQILELVNSLNAFKNHFYGGLNDILLGQFGREYANGAFSARLHFPKPGALYIATHQQSEYFEFKGQEEASEAKMYLTTEPVLLDNFIQELKGLSNGINDVAKLVCS